MDEYLAQGERMAVMAAPENGPASVPSTRYWEHYPCKGIRIMQKRKIVQCNDSRQKKAIASNL